MTENDQAAELFKGLRALSQASFPKRCANCGAVYESVQDYVRRTADIGGQSGLKKGADDDDKDIVQLFRNCVCGSTLMDFFDNRRDVSASGLRKRKLFGRLMQMLMAKELPAPEAREQLLKVLRGERSEVLTKMGFRLKIGGAHKNNG